MSLRRRRPGKGLRALCGAWLKEQIGVRARTDRSSICQASKKVSEGKLALNHGQNQRAKSSLTDRLMHNIIFNSRFCFLSGDAAGELRYRRLFFILRNLRKSAKFVDGTK